MYTQGLLGERDAEGKSLILEYEKIKKMVGRAIAENPGDVFLIDRPKVRCGHWCELGHRVSCARCGLLGRLFSIVPIVCTDQGIPLVLTELITPHIFV